MSPNIPISCEYDHLPYVPEKFGGTGGDDPPRPTPKLHKGERPYAELRAASAFSFLDGASLPEDLIYNAAQKDIPAMALIDTNGVYGAPRFYGAAKKAGVKAIVGAEVVIDNDAPVKGLKLTRMDAARSNAREARLTLLVEN